MGCLMLFAMILDLFIWFIRDPVIGIACSCKADWASVVAPAFGSPTEKICSFDGGLTGFNPG